MSVHGTSASTTPADLEGDATVSLHATTVEAGIATLSVSGTAPNSPRDQSAANEGDATTPTRPAEAARKEVGASSVEGEDEGGTGPLHVSKRHNRLHLQRLSLSDSSPTRREVPPTPLALRREGILPRSLPVDSIPTVVARTPSPEQTRRVLSERVGSGDACGLGLAVSTSPGHTPDAVDDRPDLGYFPALGSARSPRLLTVSMDAPSSPASTAPPSPHVVRSSAFGADLLRPRTPLSPSHVPGAPTLGAGGHGFEWPAFSPPATPTSPVIRAALGGTVSS